mmetsp:Transcript_63176/g.159355  ORF Transcript_63176/g.159355 Transcript_63176/m.159355 type:complete len:717 (-) Transcript_63176:89-2239(-)
MLNRHGVRPCFRRRAVCARWMKLNRRRQLAAAGGGSPRGAASRAMNEALAESALSDDDEREANDLAVDDGTPDADGDEEMPAADANDDGAKPMVVSAEPVAADSAATGSPSIRCSANATTALTSVPLDPTEPAQAAEDTEAVAAIGGEGPAAEKPRRLVTLLPSVFEGRPPVLLFSYTTACGAKQRPMDRAIHTGPEAPKMYYSHTDKVHEYNAVINIMRQGGLYRVRLDTQRWSLLWSNHPPPETLRAIKPAQKTNHFPGSWHLGRKDLIWRNILRMHRRFGVPYNITPQSFILPKNMAAFDAARVRSPNGLWIWKPCSQSCGRGIKVLNSNMCQDETKELNRKRGIIQKYIPNPLLLDGYKFDLRIYVVVVSYDPLKVYINDEGLVRIATEKFSSSHDTLESRTMHLTNYSVNKQSPAFVQNSDGKDQKDGKSPSTSTAQAEEEEGLGAFKWSLAELRAHFEQKGWDYDAMFDGIKDVVIKTLIAVEAPIQMEWSKALEQEEEGWAAKGPAGATRNSCFEMYGFDVLIDDAMKSWLLEVNICPSLSSGSPLDKRIKTKLVADTLTLVGIRPPPSLWRKKSGSMKRAASTDVIEANADGKDACACISAMSRETLEKRAARFLECETPLEAVALFEQAEWELVLDSHDEDMRCGGLQRIYPTAESAQYVPFLGTESYCNIVLRMWQEAGGGDLFAQSESCKVLPPWVPSQVCFSRT